MSDRRYFQEFTSGRATPDVIVEPAVSSVTGNWTTIFARKILGRDGKIIGFASRGVEPTHFEAFVASLALGSDTAISMIHRDGTIIARYPQDARLVGRNVSGLAVVPARAGAGRQHLRALCQPVTGRGQGRRRQVAAPFSDPDRRHHHDRDRARRLARADQAAVLRRRARRDGGRRHDLLHRAPVAAPAPDAQRLLSEKRQHLDTAINNMTQGLLLFDASGRLVICNQQYIDMFGVSPDVVKPGCHLRRSDPPSPATRIVRRRRRCLLREIS